ncbi:HK97 family phage prohead protease [Mesorhizobium kowhaii]|uniref:HK97 family phage prohead protease n=1 Tax=Mesorhizobium kowhaii TaxID=1300272 RepID=UPI0035E5050F
MSDDEGEMHYLGGGFITMWDGKSRGRPQYAMDEMKRRPPAEPRPGLRITLGGYASVFNKVHLDHEGKQIEVFSPGCFARGLHDGRAIRFLVRHHEIKCLATTADSLELLADDVGLAFRCALSAGDPADEAIALARTNAAGMSVGYRVVQDEVRTIDGHKVRFLRDVSLDEITICPPGKGCVREAYCVVINDNSRTLRQMCESKTLADEWSSVAFRRALGSFADQLTGLATK